MIEILDKINDTYKKVSDDLEVIIHPATGDVCMLKEYEIEGKKITGVIFKEDKTIMILYQPQEKE